MRGAQHALVLAFGVDHAHRLGLGLGEHRLHDEAGAEGEALEQRGVLVEIGDGPRRHPRLHRRLRHRRRDAQNQPGIKRARDQRARAKTLRLASVETLGDRIRRRLARELRDGLDGGVLHLLVDGAGADIERAAEDEGKAEDVVDLVRIVGAAGADHGVRAHLARLLRHDLRGRVGERHDQRLVGHRLGHLRLEHAGRRETDEDVGTADDVAERPLVSLLRIDRLPAVHRGVAALMHEAVDVADPDVLALRAHRHQKIERRDRRGPCPGRHDLDVGEFLAVQPEAVGDGGGDDDGGAVLIVMEDRDLHALLELRLDLEAFRSADVFQIDAAEGRFERRHSLDHAIDGVGGDLDVEHVDAGEFLEQDGLALHHRLGCQRADIAEAEHGGTVGDHGDQIGAGSQRGGFRRVLGDLGAGRGDARRIGQREVALVGKRLACLDLELSRARQTMVGERRLVEIIRIGRHAVSRLALPASKMHDPKAAVQADRISGSWKRDEARRAPRWQHPIARPSTGRAVKYLKTIAFPGPRGVSRIWQVARCKTSNWSWE
ncbi:hypothetical protein AB7M11_006368 [Bradyrhizobium ottawaense]